MIGLAGVLEAVAAMSMVPCLSGDAGTGVLASAGGLCGASGNPPHLAASEALDKFSSLLFGFRAEDGGGGGVPPFLFLLLETTSVEKDLL